MPDLRKFARLKKLTVSVQALYSASYDESLLDLPAIAALLLHMLHLGSCIICSLALWYVALGLLLILWLLLTQAFGSLFPVRLRAAG